MSMKVLQINKYYYLKGGADAVLFNTIKLLEEHGHQVIPFCTIRNQNRYSPYSHYFVNAPEIRDIKGILGKIESIPKFFWNKGAASKLESLIIEEKPDIAHLHNIFNAHSLAILPILKKYKIPVVITLHDARFLCPSSLFQLRGDLCKNCRSSLYLNCALHKCFQGNLLNSVMCSAEMIHKEFLMNYNRYINKYIFVSQRYLTLHSERHKYFADKGTVLYNFFPDINKIEPNSKKGDYFLYYGRITKEKGIEPLLKAFERMPNLSLKIAGTGPLSNLFSDTSPNIEYLGFVSGESLISLIKNASFVIVPSEWEENNPLTIIEAYACGKPVIGSRIGGIPEIIRENNTGFIFEAGDFKDLISKIEISAKIIQDEYSEMSQFCRNFAERNFDSEVHYNRLMNIYKEAIESYENI